MKGFCSDFFLAMLPFGYYKLKYDHPSGAEVKQLLQAAKACGSNPAGPFLKKIKLEFLCFFGLSSVCPFLSAQFP